VEANVNVNKLNGETVWNELHMQARQGKKVRCHWQVAIYEQPILLWPATIAGVQTLSKAPGSHLKILGTKG